MSDNIPPDLIERELDAQLRIPTEIWTDIFKLLPRRVLVQKVSPVCYRFKEICNKNVKNIHLITRHDLFTGKLEVDDSEANQQLEHLAGNDCQLASQFRLYYSYFSIHDQKSQSILRHCLDLFNGCEIRLESNEKNKSSALSMECLTELEMAKPAQIINQRGDQVRFFWHHPTFQRCTRVRLYFWPSLSAATMTAEFVNISNWLHQPNGMDCDGNAAADQQVRCMVVQLYDHDRQHTDWLLNRCSQNLQQSQGPTDRRPFVFSFNYWGGSWPGFDQFRRTENTSTGEVLILDRLVRNTGGPNYRLRRCLAEEAANGPEFYAGMFNRDCEYEGFNIDEDKIPKVMLH